MGHWRSIWNWLDAQRPVRAPTPFRRRARGAKRLPLTVWNIDGSDCLTVPIGCSPRSQGHSGPVFWSRSKLPVGKTPN